MKCGSAVQRYLAVHEVGCCSLLAGTSFVVFMTLLPLVIDPSVLTFVLDLEPAACLTVHSAALNGTSNCTWTSCQQGCTVDIYKCWHVNVSYLLADPALAAERLDRQLLASPYPPPPQQPARLYPNVVGCGYPPDVDCDQFFRDYAQTGAFERTFPCYVSMTDPSVAVIHVDRFQAACHLAIGLAPLFLCLVLSVYVSLRLRCQRRNQLTARAAGLVSAARLAEEQARRIVESKRRLESRKQSWLNSFRQDRITSSTSVAYSPSSPPPPPPPNRFVSGFPAVPYPAISDDRGPLAVAHEPALASVKGKQCRQQHLDFERREQLHGREKSIDDGCPLAGQPSSFACPSSPPPMSQTGTDSAVIACISAALLQQHHYSPLPVDSPET
ncbi:uncharacterized protein LOC130698523 [Daphnia carinata]|uniref:uncharacterized protein LOC130698523 n=1 Tax=Daphnia carinata TaxID=120202 RepID=UPI00258062E7|nr:uncharacterized protein LOC130698523 [Daphnia carinata]